MSLVNGVVRVLYSLLFVHDMSFLDSFVLSRVLTILFAVQDVVLLLVFVIMTYKTSRLYCGRKLLKTAAVIPFEEVRPSAEQLKKICLICLEPITERDPVPKQIFCSHCHHFYCLAMVPENQPRCFRCRDKYKKLLKQLDSVGSTPLIPNRFTSSQSEFKPTE